MKPRVIVAPDFRQMSEVFDPPTLERLEQVAEIVWGRDGPMPHDEFRASLEDATGVVFGTWHYGHDAISEAGDSLRYIYEVAGGLKHPGLDYAACFERGISVGGCAPAFGPVVAEMALAMTLDAARLVSVGDRAFRAGEERWLHAGNDGAVTLFGKTFGFVGAGGLSLVLQRLVEPFGGRIVAYDPWLEPGRLATRGIESVGLEELFDVSDVVFVLAVPSPDNEGLISRDLMERLSPTDILAVISRSHLVDFEAMTDLVLDGRFRLAIDVFPREPLERDHRIRSAANAVFSAHRAGALPVALHEIGRMVVDDFEAVLAGREPSRMQYATPELVARLYQ